MKTLNINTMTAFLAAALLLGCTEVNPTYTPPTSDSDDNKTEVSTGFALGADISWTTKLENENYTFQNSAGETRECTALMKEIGMNAIRLRVWVNPAEGWCNAGDVLVKAQRAQKLGMRLMIDFHYSDSWADPDTQVIPAAWREYTTEQLTQAVTSHTTEVLTILKNNGVSNVEWVQVGNEVTRGMLQHTASDPETDAGTTESEYGGNISTHPQNFVAFVNAGYDAVKAVYPDAKVIVHVDQGHNFNRSNAFNVLRDNNGKYDVIGLSIYPNGVDSRITDCVNNIATFYETYGKEVMICEVGMQYDEAEQAYNQLTSLISGAKASSHCLGVFYWEPEAPAGYNNGYTMGAFDNGRPTHALDAFTEAAEDGSGSSEDSGSNE